jgi:hypothetical protein
LTGGLDGTGGLPGALQFLVSAQAIEQTPVYVVGIIDRRIGEVIGHQRAADTRFQALDTDLLTVHFVPRFELTGQARAHTSSLTMYHSPAVNVPSPQSAQRDLMLRA